MPWRRCPFIPERKPDIGLVTWFCIPSMLPSLSGFSDCDKYGNNDWHLQRAYLRGVG